MRRLALMMLAIMCAFMVFHAQVVHCSEETDVSEERESAEADVETSIEEANPDEPEEYGRGPGFGWKLGDSLNDSGMFRRCQEAHGRGNCEKFGSEAYPKCKSGYVAKGCCLCAKVKPKLEYDRGSSFPSLRRCEAAHGKTNCEKLGTVFYPKCKSGYAVEGCCLCRELVS
jgi:hypothetical protein